MIRSSRSPVTVAMAAVLMLGVPAGCGRDAAETAAGDHATIETLLAAYDRASTGIERRDHDRMLALVHAENERQVRLRQVVMDARPLLDLDLALWEHFGGGMNPHATAPPLAPNATPARLTTTIGHRAKAMYTRADGTNGVLYLVQTDDGWWISGHTLERDAGVGEDDAALEAMEGLNHYLAPVAPAIEERVRRGELKSLAEAGVALGAAAAERSPELQGRPDLMFGAAPVARALRLTNHPTLHAVRA